MNENEPTKTPDRSQDDTIDEDAIAEVFAPSESEDDADITYFPMVSALIAAGVDWTCAELYTLFRFWFRFLEIIGVCLCV